MLKFLKKEKWKIIFGIWFIWINFYVIALNAKNDFLIKKIHQDELRYKYHFKSLEKGYFSLKNKLKYLNDKNSTKPSEKKQITTTPSKKHSTTKKNDCQEIVDDRILI